MYKKVNTAHAQERRPTPTNSKSDDLVSDWRAFIIKAPRKHGSAARLSTDLSQLPLGSIKSARIPIICRGNMNTSAVEFVICCTLGSSGVEFMMCCTAGYITRRMCDMFWCWCSGRHTRVFVCRKNEKPYQPALSLKDSGFHLN
jgi:hypothetical protein